MKSSTNVRHLALGGLIAAVYVILSVGLAPISYGPVQLRVAEALTILAVLSPVAIPGLTVGCLLANLVGVYLGMTLPLDVVIGTLATFLAAVASYGLRRFTVGGLPLLSGLMPVLFNAVIVGWELWYFFTEVHTLGTFLLNAFWVGIGELIAVMVLGMILYQVLKKSGLGRVLFSGARQA